MTSVCGPASACTSVVGADGDQLAAGDRDRGRPADRAVHREHAAADDRGLRDLGRRRPKAQLGAQARRQDRGAALHERRREIGCRSERAGYRRDRPRARIFASLTTKSIASRAASARGKARPMATDARERILEAACDLIASDGIDDVRIARVATRARASTALVHHYFSTREELLEQALVHSFETAGAGALRRGAGRPSRARAAASARAIEACLPLPGEQERDWTLWVELWLRAVRGPQLRPLAADLYGRYREWFATFIAAGLEQRGVRVRAPRDRARRPRGRAGRRPRDSRHGPRPGDGHRARPAA